jgi:hypothetical protein
MIRTSRTSSPIAPVQVPLMLIPTTFSDAGKMVYLVVILFLFLKTRRVIILFSNLREMQFLRKPIENFKSRPRIANDLSCRVANEYTCWRNLLYVHIKYVEVSEFDIELTERFLHLRAPWKLLDASRTDDFWAQGS